MSREEHGSDLSITEVQQLLRILGDRSAREIVRRSKHVRLEDVFFDDHGRRFPSFYDLESRFHDPAVHRPAADWLFFHPAGHKPVDYAARRERLRQYLPVELPLVSAEEFEQQSQSLLQALKKDPRVSNILCFSYVVPICLPQVTVGGMEYADIFRQIFLPTVRRAWREQFPDRKFSCRMQYPFTVKAESRHGELLLRMRNAPQVALFFPAVLEGFSPDAAQSSLEELPLLGFTLGGAIDTAVALVMYTDYFKGCTAGGGFRLGGITYPRTDDSGRETELYFLIGHYYGPVRKWKDRIGFHSTTRPCNKSGGEWSFSVPLLYST